MNIKLRVPSKPAADYVEHGNFAAELKPKSTIIVHNRRFADFLIQDYGLAEVEHLPKPAAPAKKKTAKVKAPAAPAADVTTNKNTNEGDK